MALQFLVGVVLIIDVHDGDVSVELLAVLGRVSISLLDPGSLDLPGVTRRVRFPILERRQRLHCRKRQQAEDDADGSFHVQCQMLLLSPSEH